MPIPASAYVIAADGNGHKQIGPFESVDAAEAWMTDAANYPSGNPNWIVATLAYRGQRPVLLTPEEARTRFRNESREAV